MKKINKRIFTLFFIFSVISFAAAAQAKRIVIFNPASEGLSADEDNWLPASIRRKLEANFNDYTSFQLVELQNEAEIKKIQKKAESSSYDQDTSIELGKLVSAEYGIFTTVTKAVSGNNVRYILSSNITDLTTGIRHSSVTTESVADIVSLFDKPGCSVNIITVNFCKDLGIKLSAIDEYLLLKGNDITNDKKIELAEDELKKYNEKMKQLDSKIKEISLSTEVSADAQKAKLEAERAMIEQQEKMAQDKLERLRRQQEQLLRDQQDQKLRSEEQRKKIEKVAKEAEEKALILRQKNLEDLTVDQIIAVIEAKKQTLIDIRKGVDAQEALIKQNAQEEYNIRAAAIDDEPLRKGEMDSNGKMLSDVKVKRINEKKEIKAELERQARIDIEEVRAATKEQQKALLQDIQNDREALKVPRTISSLKDDRILFVGNYAGEKFEWDGTASFYISDYCIFAQKVGIDYKTVTGKLPARATDASEKWNDYLDTVDLYDYMFRRQVPVIALEIDYVVEALDDSHPSGYKITIDSFRLKDIRQDKTIQTIKPQKSGWIFTVKPETDIRSDDFIDVEVSTKQKPSKKDSKANKKQKPKTKETAKQEKSASKPAKPAKKSSSKVKNSAYDQTKNGGKRFNMGANLGGILATDYFDEPRVPIFGYAYCSVPLNNYIFAQLDVGFTPVPDRFGKFVCKSEDLIFTDIDLGVNIRAALGNYYPNLYAYAGAGLGYSDDLHVYGKTKDTSVFHYKFGAGIDLPISEGMCLTCEYVYSSIEAAGGLSAVLVGAALTIPD